MDIEYRDISYVLAVYEERSFSRAAERCFVTQPAISRIIKRVESQAGVQLFDRSTSPLAVTPEGEVFIGYFQRISDLYREMKDYTEELKRRQIDCLNIAAPSFFCPHMLPPLIAAFRAENPGFSVKLIETNDDDLRRLLGSGIVDAGVSVEGSMPPQCTQQVLMQEHILLAVPAGLPVNEGLENCALTAQDLRDRRYLREDVPAVPLSVFSRENFLFLKHGNDLHKRGMDMCHAAGFSPLITMELDQLLSAYYLAENGAGLTFVRAGIPRYVGVSDKLLFYKIDHPEIVRDIYIYLRKKEYTDLQNRFLAFLEGKKLPG